MATFSLKSLAKRLFALAGLRLLTQRQTVEVLRPWQTATFPGKPHPMPAVADAVEPQRVVFETKYAVPHTGFVWTYQPARPRARLLPSGNLLAEGRVLCTDFSVQDAATDLLRPARRKPVRVPTLVAPFGHYQDGVAFGGYYDFMLLVAAKLSLIREARPDLSFADAAVAYPLFGTDYEREFLTHIGFAPDRVLDSRHHAARFDTCLLANNGDWYYPNPASLLALRRQLLPLVTNPDAPRERIYICRAGRRRVLNEDALTRMLTDYGFRIVADQPRSLAEQAALYHGASFVLGPHGASFANIVCCQPGTQLFELFAPGYVPDFFLYMTQQLGLNYAAHVTGSKTYTPTGVTGQDQAANLTVSVSEVERSLNRILEQQHRQGH